MKIIVADASAAQTLDYQSLFVLPLSSLKVTLLINNVGVVCEGGSNIPYIPATEATDQDVISVINTNNVFLSLLTKHMIPVLSQNKSALIVNISSTLSVIPMPYISYYSASKTFVNTFSDILNLELSMVFYFIYFKFICIIPFVSLFYIFLSHININNRILRQEE